jgi:hypothetical protein
MSYVSSIELRKVRPEAVKYKLDIDIKFHSYIIFHSSEKGVLESVVDLFHDVVEKVPQVSFYISKKII